MPARWYAGRAGRTTHAERFEAALLRSDLYHRVPLTLTWVGDSLRWLLIVERLPLGAEATWVFAEVKRLHARYTGHSQLLVGDGELGPPGWLDAQT